MHNIVILDPYAHLFSNLLLTLNLLLIKKRAIKRLIRLSFIDGKVYYPRSLKNEWGHWFRINGYTNVYSCSLFQWWFYLPYFTG